MIKVGEDDEPVASKPVPQPVAAWPRTAVRPDVVVPPGQRKRTSPWTLPRWVRVRLFTGALGLRF